MPLDQAQQQRALAALQPHLGACPVCRHQGANQFTLGEIIIAPNMPRPGSVHGPGTVPMLQVVCTTCNHVLLFAAHPMQLP